MDAHARFLLAVRLLAFNLQLHCCRAGHDVPPTGSDPNDNLHTGACTEFEGPSFDTEV